MHGTTVKKIDMLLLSPLILPEITLLSLLGKYSAVPTAYVFT